MAIPATPVEVRFAQGDQRKFGKFLLPGQLDIAQNLVQVEEGVYEKRDGYSPISNATGADPAIDSPTDVGMAGELMAQVASNGLYTRGPAASEWRRAEPHQPAFATYETALPSSGFRPTRLVDGNGRTWHFSATQDINATTGSTNRYPIYRVVDTDGRELVPPTIISSLSISAGKPILVGTRIFFYYHEFSTGVHVANFNTASPTTPPTVTLNAYPAASGVLLGFDVRVVPDTDEGIIMVWGNGINGGTGAVGVSRLNATTGALSGIVYSNLTGNVAALYAAVLARTDEAGRGFFGAVTGNNATQALYALEINTGTLACTFTQLTVGDFGGVHQLGAVIHDGNLEVFWADCRQLMSAATPLPPPEPALWRLTLDLGTMTPTSDFIMYGWWLVADPIVYGDQILLILGHESAHSSAAFPQLAPQRCFGLFDVTGERWLSRAMYEIGGGDCDGLAGAGTGFVQGSFVTEAEVDGDEIIVNVNACRDGLRDFYTSTLTFDLAPVFGPAVQVEDKLFVPGAYPRWLGGWGRALDASPMLFPEHVTVTAATGAAFPVYAGAFQVCATYVFVAPDGSEIESQASEIEDITTTASQWVRVVVPTCKMTSGTDAALKCFVRVYSSADAGSTLFRQATKPNRLDADTLTFDLPSIGVGPTLYQEGAIEHVPCPPCRVARYWDQRLFVSDTSEVGVVYPSNFIENGQLPAFIDDGKFSVAARVRALCPVSKDYLAIFHDDGIAVIARGGHSAAGTNVYEAIHLASVLQTTLNARSVVATEKGCVFQGTDGNTYLLTTSLQVVFVGRGVDDVKAETVTSAVYMTETKHVRLTTSGGKVLVFDLGHLPAVQTSIEDTIGQWYTWPLAVTGGMVATMVKDGEHHILAGNGGLWRQVANQAFDNVDTFIPMKARLPLSFQGIIAYLRCLRGVLLTQWIASHVLQLTLDTDGIATLFDPKVLSGATKRADFRPNPSKASHFVLTFEEQQSGILLNKGFKFEGLGFEVQRQPGLARGQTRIE